MRKSLWRLLTALVGVSLMAGAADKEIQNPKSKIQNVVGPLTPEQAIATFKVEPGVRVEVAAAEPLTADPAAIAFDERGRMFVAEERGYPTGPGEGKPPAGIIAILEDTDGDGRYDKRTVFADGLTFPNGIMPWRGGIFVTCAPDIFYLKDSDGDGRADVRKVVLTGYNTNSTTQIRVSHPTLGLDNWIYVTAGLTGGKVKCPEHPERPTVEFAKGDTRFRPDTLELETVSGVGQFGLSLDDAGHKFVCSNRNPLQQTVLQSRYLKRNPYLAFSDMVQDVAKHGEEGVVYPISPDTTTASFMPSLLNHPHAGTFTSACGITIFRGTALGADHYGNPFVCEPAQNLVQRQVMTAAGGTFSAKIAHDGADFLASPDTWCRPVFAANGPDGALYICDMYRKVIDHPQYLPEAIRATADFESGKNMGRIYRVVSAKTKPGALPKPKLAQASVKQLVVYLGDANGWTRDTARRLLLERADPKSAALLRAQVKSGKTEHARLLALCTLDGLGKLDDDQVRIALADKSAGVRENAIRLAEARLSKTPDFAARVIALADDADSHVRFQCALTLGEIADARIIPPLAKIAARDMADRWARAAVLSSINGRVDEFLQALLAAPGVKSDEAMPTMMADLGRLFGASQPPEKCVALINEITASSEAKEAAWQPGTITGLAEGLRSRGSALVKILVGDSPPVKLARERLGAVMNRSVKIAVDVRLPVSSRLAALSMLGQSSYDIVGKALQGMVNATQPAEIQIASIRALGQIADPAAGKALLERARWRAYMPPTREAILATVASQPRLLPSLLDALESGDVAPTTIDPTRRTQLMKHRDEKIRKRAEEIFKDLTGGNRQKVYEDYKAILTMPANVGNGQEKFKKTCAQCHTFAGEGAKVGPDLTGVRNQPSEALLMHILMPSYEILPGYQAFEIETKDGRTLTGLIASETETSVTLRRALGEQDTILRSNIESITSANLSLMPDELEKTMTKQDLRDIIGFLKGETSAK